MSWAFRGMMMTDKVLVFTSNMTKGEGRPGARKMIELAPACIQNETGKKREGERQGPRALRLGSFWAGRAGD